LKQGVHQVHWFFGALWMIRRSTMEEVGYLDEEYRMALFEDLDYVMRILGRGKHMKVIGHCKHVGGASRVYLEGDQNAERQNRARFVHKWRSLWPDPSFQ
jgi:GT2 family glycosyltransferase